MNYNIKEVAQRLKGLREDLDLSMEDFADKVGIRICDYKLIESGEKDFSISFLYKCAEIFDVELIELLTGTSPTLSTFSVVRKGKGLPIERRENFSYQHLAYMFKDKCIEPLLVTAPFEEQQQNKPITLSVHEGQEFDYLLKGKLKFVIGGHSEVLEQGDSVFYNSSTPHGMIAVDGEDCEFIAVLMTK